MVYYSTLQGEKIKLLRESFNMSQTKMAAKLGVTKSTILCWENGKRKIPDHQAVKIAKIFEMSEAWLLDDGEEELFNPVLKKDFVFPFKSADTNTITTPAKALPKQDDDKKHFDALYASLSEYRKGMVYGYLVALCNEEFIKMA